MGQIGNSATNRFDNGALVGSNPIRLGDWHLANGLAADQVGSLPQEH